MNKTIFIILSLLLILNCSAPQTKRSVTTTSIINLQVIATIGPDITGSRPLNSPRSIAVNHSGEIYIADFGNDRVVKLDSSYNLIKEVGGFGSGEYALKGPIDLALDKVSNLYVADFGNKRIVRLDRHLNFSGAEEGFTRDKVTEFIRPVSVELSNRGEVLVGDEGLGACYKLDQFFSYIFEFGGRDEIFSVIYPSDICYDNGDIYVTDPEYGYIFTYDDFGMFTGKIGEDIIQSPSAIAVSPGVGLWVTDKNSGTLHLLNYRGKELFRWNGYGEYRLYRPEDVFVDDNDKIYLVDSQTSRIYVLRPLAGN